MKAINHNRCENIAYFSMEIALDERIPTYCGGLGILAGDTLRSCADLGVPAVGVTLVSEKGFFRQNIRQRKQIEEEEPWNPVEWMNPLKTKVTVPIGGCDVVVKAWEYHIVGSRKHRVPVLLLDTNTPENNDEDKNITSYLYGGDAEYRLKQEMVLGVGGVRMLQEAGYVTKKYHMNEGHSSLLALELLKQGYDATEVKKKCIFTTHTPIESGHDKFSYDLVERVFQGYFDLEMVKRYGGEDYMNMTLLGFNLSGYINGVAKKHSEVSRSMFPGYEVNAITNGVHPETWTCRSFKRLYDKHIKYWRRDPFLFRYIVGVPNEEVWMAHVEAKKNLIKQLNKEYGKHFSLEKLTIGFARRMTEYKRPALIFSNTKKLRDIAKEHKGIQMVFSGKAHPRDYRGKELIEEVIGNIEELRNDIEAVYVQDYNMEVAKKIVAGVDLWLNTPQKPKEASGTSGMKATLNGVLNFSVLDGWWIEGHIEDITGWSIGGLESELEQEKCVEELYTKLRKIVVVYYKDRLRWVNMMKNAISLNAAFFNSHRMVQQYLVNAYMD